jgi:outer membrane protein TolC
MMISFSTNQAIAKKQPKETINKYDYINMPFWKKFNDEILINHLNTMYENNYDLKIATYNTQESEKIVKLALANELPQIAFDGYVGRTLTSSDIKHGDVLIPDYSQYRYLLPLTLNYEVDLWGKNRLQTKAMKKQLDIVKEDERSLYITLCANLAINYFNLIKTDKLIEIQENLIKIQSQLCNLTLKRFEHGLATQNELLGEEKNLTYLKEEYNNLLEKRDVLLNQINVFLGDRSFKEVERLSFSSIKPSIIIPESIDFSIAEQRPDVKKSLLKLEKAGYDVRIAKKDILPSFTISGTLGYNAYQLGHLFGTKTGLASVGVAPYLDIFDGGRKINIEKLMKTRYNKSFEEYNKNLLTSAQDINDALYSAKISAKNEKISNQRYLIQQKDTNLILQKEKIGTANIIDTLVKQEETLQISKETTSAKINEIISAINIYKATGGIDVFESKNTDL